MLACAMLEDLGTPIPGIALTFSSDAEEQADWQVVRFDAWERASGAQTPYQVSIDLLCEDEYADPFALDGSSCTLTVNRGEVVARRFHGIVLATSLTGWRSRGGAVFAKVEIVPAFACLAQGSTYRRFQDLSVPQILKDLLTAALAPYGREISPRLSDDGDTGKRRTDRYLPRDFCVQRDESDFSFARRLMEEEGISFFFEDAGDRERLVLVDSNPSFPSIDERLPVRLLARTSSARHFECVEDLVLATHAVPASTAVKTFEATRPRADLSARAKSVPPDSSDRKDLPAMFGREEVYQFGAGVVSAGYKGGEYTQSDRQWKADIRLQEAQTGALVGQGSGNVTSFAFGRRFKVDSGRKLLDREYLLVGVTHHGEQGLGGGTSAGGGYSNTFDCIPSAIPFRPARQTRRQRAFFDVAVVVGPPGIDDDIFVDEHGRIRVNFVWNRDDLETTEPDQARSCWIPVAQGWLGSGLGIQIIPRRGMRVLVGYTDGDPERPIVLHCIETGAARLLYDPSKENQKTRSVFFRTQTSPPGNAPRHNEISTQDAPEKEEILVHAARDLRLRVDQDEDVIVTRNEQRKVGGTRSQTVHGKETLANEASRTTTIEKDDIRNTKGAETVDIRGERTTTVGGKDTLTAEADRETIIKGSDTQHVADRREITVDKALVFHQGDTVVECSRGNAEANVAGWLRVRRGGAQIFVDESGNVSVTTDHELRLEATGASLRLADGKVQIAADAEVELSVGASTVKLDPSGVATSGNSITDSASVLHQTTAPIVAQN
jgi:type VI secretion system secreted protein VgrG